MYPSFIFYLYLYFYRYLYFSKTPPSVTLRLLAFLNSAPGQVTISPPLMLLCLNESGGFEVFEVFGFVK